MLRSHAKQMLLALVGVSAVAAANADNAVRRLDVPAGDLVSALRALEQQSDVEFVYHAAQLQGVQTKGVAGTLTVQEAVRRLIEGTSLRMEVDAQTGAMLISPTAAAVSQPNSAVVRLAQQTSPRAPTEPAREAQSVQIDEIVVTATRRSERLRDVPMSISALTMEDIERRGLLNAADYLRGVPGTNQVEAGPFGQSIVIRGIETSPESQNFNSGTTTATYFGETPTTNSAGMAGNSNVDLKLVDIARVEVLRGPQGTSFGNSSLGGAVRVVPVAPNLQRLEAKLAANYSNTEGFGGDNYSLQAVGNLPLLDNRLAIRSAVYKYEDSGFYRNRAASRPAFLATLPAGASAFAADDDEVGAQSVTGGRVAMLFRASDALDITLSHIIQKTELDGIAIANSGEFEQTLLRVAPEQVRDGRSGGFYDMDIAITNATLEYDLSWADLLASYSHIESEGASAFGFAYLGSPLAMSGDAFSKHKENIGEVRIATKLDGQWDFLAGLYYEDVDDGDNEHPYQTFYWLGDPSTNIFQPGGAALVGTAFDKRNLEQKAAFGEASWRFLPGWTFTAGIRYYDYERTRQLAASGPFVAALGAWTNDVSASGTNPRANLNYKPSDNSMIYASWSQGFRLGRPQNPLPASLCDRNSDGLIDGTGNTIASTGTLNSDEVDSYELGGKWSLLDRRLSIDATVFHMEWSDMPANLRAPDGPVGCGLNYLVNAGSARSRGVELQMDLQITAPLRLSLGGSYIDATLTDNLPGTTNTKGNRLAGAPEYNASLGLEYRFDLGRHELSLRADSIYIGELYGNVLESPTSRAGDYVKLDTSARLELSNLSIDLFVRNLTNEDAFAYRRGGAGAFYGSRLRPRTVGLQLSTSF